MYASKENARKAREDFLERIWSVISDEWRTGEAAHEAQKFLIDFLIAAERKLPTEATYRREEQRRAGTRKTGQGVR